MILGALKQPIFEIRFLSVSGYPVLFGSHFPKSLKMWLFKGYNVFIPDL